MDFTLLQRIRVPAELESYAVEIVDKTLQTKGEVQDGILEIFSEEDTPLEHTSEIENIEGAIDDLERNFIQDLFETELSLSHKILLRQYVENLVEISDRAEDLSDAMEILIATRRT